MEPSCAFAAINRSNHMLPAPHPRLGETRPQGETRPHAGESFRDSFIPLVCMFCQLGWKVTPKVIARNFVPNPL